MLSLDTQRPCSFTRHQWTQRQKRTRQPCIVCLHHDAHAQAVTNGLPGRLQAYPHSLIPPPERPRTDHRFRFRFKFRCRLRRGAQVGCQPQQVTEYAASCDLRARARSPAPRGPTCQAGERGREAAAQLHTCRSSSTKGLAQSLDARMHVLQINCIRGASAQGEAGYPHNC